MTRHTYVFAAILLLAVVAYGQEGSSSTTAAPMIVEARSAESTTTTVAPGSKQGEEQKTDQTAESSEPAPVGQPPESKPEGGEDGSEPEARIYIIHHHYRDPVGYPHSRAVPMMPFSTTVVRPMKNFYRPRRPPMNPASMDPLGNFTREEKRRQYQQDWLMNKLNMFESQLEPMVEEEKNSTVKTDMEEVIGAVKELKQTLSNHQIFNISEVISKWVEDRMKRAEQEENEQESPESSLQPGGKPEPLTTYRLVPRASVAPTTTVQQHPLMYRYNIMHQPGPVYFQQRPNYGMQPFAYQRQNVSPSTDTTLLHRPTSQTGSSMGDFASNNEIIAY